MTDRPNVLVTGGAGYIGSHMVLALLDAGYSPLILDDFSTGHRDRRRDALLLLPQQEMMRPSEGRNGREEA